MTQKTTSPYGSWKSPIAAEMVAKHSVKIGSVVLSENDTYWIEMRPKEAGRNVIVRQNANGDVTDVTPEPYNVRTTVHEYGGGAFAVSDDVIYFANFKDQRLYAQVVGQEPWPITPEGDMRFADLIPDIGNNRLVCVREDHSGSGEASNTIVALDLEGQSEGTMLVSGNDFYASPRLSPDERKLAWITWNHPNMPWDGTELWVADVQHDGGLANERLVAGGPEESIFQPTWSPDGVLHFVSDASGWWNLYRQIEGKNEHLCVKEAEFGLPQWVFGMSTYAILSANHMLCAYNDLGVWHIVSLDIESGLLTDIDQPYTAIAGLWGNGDRVIYVGATPKEPHAIIEFNRKTNELAIIRRSGDPMENEGYLSFPEVIEFPTSEERTAFAYYYGPNNHKYEAPSGDLPPLLVISHGGPTGSTSTTFNAMVQFWTSRGFALLDVNYGGSTGYGRAYRERLNGKWGIVDVDDCVNGAKFLVDRKLVDGTRLAIRGGSAGGYTTFAALAFRDFFQAGASYYGVSDIEVLAKETHKFESRYMNNLVGPYPEALETLRERSPIYHVDKLSSPLILFQGLEDRVVLPNQSEMMVEALRKKGVPVAYIPFEGEQHGFRQAKNIIRSLEAELYFYSKIFHFELADQIEPVEIENI